MAQLSSHQSTEEYISARRIGEADIILVSEGILPWPPDLQAPEKEWRAAIPEADEYGVVPLGVHTGLVRLGSATVLIDPGYDDPGSPWDERFAVETPGLRRTPGLAAALSGLDISPDDVTHVLITHTHGDHYCGVTRQENYRLVVRYPNARHMLGRQDWEGNPERDDPGSDIAQRLGLIDRLGMLDLVDADTEVAPSVAMIPAPGETAGHSIVRVRSGGSSFYYLGDLYHHSCEVEHPGWVSAGRDPVAMQISRARLTAEAVPSGAVLAFTHERFPPWGRIVPNGSGHRWERG